MIYTWFVGDKKFGMIHITAMCLIWYHIYNVYIYIINDKNMINSHVYIHTWELIDTLSLKA